MVKLNIICIFQLISTCHINIMTDNSEAANNTWFANSKKLWLHIHLNSDYIYSDECGEKNRNPPVDHVAHSINYHVNVALSLTLNSELDTYCCVVCLLGADSWMYLLLVDEPRPFKLSDKRCSSFAACVLVQQSVAAGSQTLCDMPTSHNRTPGSFTKRSCCCFKI